MDKRYLFDYYYGAEADQFSFFRIPKSLFKDKRFMNISTDAKVLYGMMLDRMSLSRRNNWIDEQNRVYIIYTLSDIMEDLNCGKDKGVHLIAELDERGIGLIERRKQGFGKPAIIYVKNFISCMESEENEKDDVPFGEENDGTVQGEFNNMFLEKDKFKSHQSLKNSGFYQTSEKPKSLGAECRSQDFGKTEVTRSEKPKSRVRKNRSQDFGKTEVNNTDINNTDKSNTYINPPPLSPPPEEFAAENEEEGLEENITGEQVYEHIKQTIEFDKCMREVKTEDGRKQVKFLLDLICDVVAHPRMQIRIGGVAIAYSDVRKRFLALTKNQVLDVIRNMQTAANIENPSAYALTALYNANKKVVPFVAMSSRQLYFGQERAYDKAELATLEMNLLRSHG